MHYQGLIYKAFIDKVAELYVNHLKDRLGGTLSLCRKPRVTAVLISTSHLLEIIQGFFLFPTLVTGSSAVHFSPGYPTFALCSSRNEPPQGYPADLWASWCPRRISKMCHPPVAISDPSLKEKERYACRAHLPQLEHETKNIRSVLLTSSRL